MHVFRREARRLELVGNVLRHFRDFVATNNGRRIDDVLEHRMSRVALGRRELGPGGRSGG